MTMQLPTEYMKALLQRCVEEDGGLHGDLTSNSAIAMDDTGSYSLHVRNHGTVAGLQPIAEAIHVFEGIELTVLRGDGEEVHDEQIAVLTGNTRSMLLAERTMLNILGHASGVATATRKFVREVAGTQCCICDTRKTTPGLRLLDKYAVTCGGGTSHRMGLHDAALYKDNHLISLTSLQSDLASAIAEVRKIPDLKFVEVEIDTLEQLTQVLEVDVDIVLLDNMSNEQLEQAIALRDVANKKVLLEASGGVDLNTVRGIAETGVDRISVGAITHHANWLDVGLDSIDG
ncbi:MAG: nicotinate-nucleotide pyrophosphorylase (carboxylating) [Phycisphaerales bacterium]|jgi:nicotinate-nucleotide pyrophosphorylase (carboxylating)